jgi:hypothetical protein
MFHMHNDIHFIQVKVANKTSTLMYVIKYAFISDVKRNNLIDI